MDNALKSLENNALTALSARAPQGVVNAIKTASAKTGVSFSYLMEKAAAESNFNPTVKAKTSSATGLFQFIESTWMDMIKQHGDKHGINTNQSKANLLNLRKNPEIASLMAAEFAQGNKAHLEKTVGGDIGNTELYFAHFMGAGGASAFLSQLNKNPDGIAADIFPKEARANRGVFYDSKTGAPRSFSQIHDFFDKKFSNSDSDIANTMAHKPNNRTNNRIRSEGYQHIPFSLKKPIQVINASDAPSLNSLYKLQNRLDAFFSQPINSFEQTQLRHFPSSLYSKINNPSSALLDILK